MKIKYKNYHYTKKQISEITTEVFKIKMELRRQISYGDFKIWWGGKRWSFFAFGWEFFISLDRN